jgi:hypothetical protein
MRVITKSLGLAMLACLVLSEPSHAFGKRRKTTRLKSSSSYSVSTASAGDCQSPAQGFFRGCYYDNVDFTALKAIHNVGQINFDWRGGGPSNGMDGDYFSARYLGDFNFEKGTYQFQLSADDGVRILIDDRVIYEDWTIHPATDRTIHYTLSGGTHRVKVEYYEAQGDASLKLSWTKSATRQQRTGVVRLSGSTFVDDGGAFNAVGASLFWATWGYKYNREKLERNLAAIAEAGFDYIRVLGVVGCSGPGLSACGSSQADAWEGKEADWRWSDYDDVIAGLTDLAYDQYGLRIEWTLIGDGQYNIPARNDRFNLVDRFLAMSRGREQKIIHFEIANEAYQNGFGGDSGAQQLRELSRYMKDRSDNLIASSAPGDTCEEGLLFYQDGVADLATWHFSRHIATADGRWRPVRQPWGYKDCPGLPAAAANNEPIGPGSSVNSERDPLKLAAHAVVTYIAKLPAYVFHSRVGVGIGERDGYHGNQDIWEMSGYNAFVALKSYLPQDLTSWFQQNHYWDGHPFRTYGNGVLNQMWPDVNGSDGVVRHYGTVQGDRFVTILVGIRNFVELEPKSDVEFDVLDPVTGVVLQHRAVAANQRFRVDGIEAAVLIGRKGPPGIYPPGSTPSPGQSAPPQSPFPSQPAPSPSSPPAQPASGCTAGSFYTDANHGWPTQPDCQRKLDEGSFSGRCEVNRFGCWGVL